MRILYIDTSSSYLYASIVSSRKVLCEVKKEFGPKTEEIENTETTTEPEEEFNE